MSARFLLSCAALTLGAGMGLAAAAQPFGPPPAPACVAPGKASQSDALADKIAAADRSIEAGKPGTWTALADVAQYACAVTGDRQRCKRSHRSNASCSGRSRLASDP